jgi:hypothetical protein
VLLIREPQAQDVERIAVCMAEIDVAECRAASHTPWQGLSEAKAMSALVWTGEVDGWPEAMFGVVSGSAVTGLGHPWLLGTTRARRQVRAFMQDAPGYLQRIEALFPRLTGRVAARNTAAIRWLCRLGFVVETHWTIRQQGELMHEFRKGF